MDVRMLPLLEGARKATGLTVIIDVFRAFSLECYIYSRGAKLIYPVGSVETALKLKEEHPDYILFGERQGAKIEGFEYGNSPSSIAHTDLSNKVIIHTTSAGTQGIVNAKNADEIITGSLINARAIADYILSVKPDTVSLVPMGKGGMCEAREDTICAEYIRAMLLEQDYNIDYQISTLRHNGGEHFFDTDNQHVFPEPDFHLCIKRDIFPFVLKIENVAPDIMKSVKFDVK
ncbi:MAG: 2-phosphosulfolactate phosphatase [Clostridiales bacterium]|nr:2-phosphosulfolactate phosphatase [Clostridiales bacterium]